jgi:hypothetical protein
MAGPSKDINRTQRPHHPETARHNCVLQNISDKNPSVFRTARKIFSSKTLVKLGVFLFADISYL